MILGIDPGKTGGWCFIKNGKTNYCGIINTHDFQYLRELALGYKSLGGFTCYLEGIHFQKGKFNPRSFSEHAISIGLVCGVMESHGVKVHIIGATTWQSKELVISGQRCPAGETKVWSVKIAESYGADLSEYTKALKPNVADAVCIAAYGEKQGRGKWIENTYTDGGKYHALISRVDGERVIYSKVNGIKQASWDYLEHIIKLAKPFTPPPCPELPDDFTMDKNGDIVYHGITAPAEKWIDFLSTMPAAEQLKKIRDHIEKWGTP